MNIFECLNNVSHNPFSRQILMFPYLAEENGMDQGNPAGEEELAVLALFKSLHQYMGR